MNKHIELVKKWLADPASVSQQELEDNRTAYAAAAEYAAAAVYDAAAAVYDPAAADAAAYWVKRYEKLRE